MFITKIKNWYQNLMEQELLDDCDSEPELVVKSHGVNMSPLFEDHMDYIATATINASIWWWDEFESLLVSGSITDGFSCKEIVGNTKHKWLKVIRLARSEYDQVHPIVCTYRQLRNIYIRKTDSPDAEWREFCAWIERLPHSESITNKED